MALSQRFQKHLGLAALFVGLAAALAYIFRAEIWQGVLFCYDLLGNKERIRAFVDAAGPLGPVAFIVIQALQVVLAPIPGEATGFIGGFLFGVPQGLLYSTIGLTLGSVAAFLLGHWLEKHVVAKIVSPETMKRLDFLIERQGVLVAFLLFLFPGFPKDYLCFILGLSHMSFKLFVVMVIVGRLPGTLMLTLQGAKVYEGDYLLTGILIVICLIVAGFMYYYRESLYRWLERWDHEPGRETGNRG
jgi:uncharacterized membrane protein YdjX (TVP38/TMEM64 family)